MAIVEKWNIKARAHRCSKTEQEFSEGDPFYTALFEDPENDGFVRQDYSETAWQELQDTLKPFSFWRSTYEPPPSDDAGPVVEKQTAESLLWRLIEEDEAHTENARYVLAVMLERDKKLRQTDTQDTDNGRYLIYEHRESGEVIIIKDPKLRLEEVEPVQDEVSQLLGAPPRELAADDDTATEDSTEPETAPPSEA
ncbi:MAG: hypothetical protein AAF591_07440 [Verrucomicrobiota bacterium]